MIISILVLKTTQLTTMKYICILLLTLIPIISWGQGSSFQAPLNPDFIQQTEKVGYVHPPHKIKHSTIKTKSSEILPDAFDLRNVNGTSYVSDIRNQNPYGTCWTFATFASVESAWRMRGDATITDLSEGNLAKCHGYEFGIDDGGNEYMATGYLTRLAGPIYEHADPYEDVNSGFCPDLVKNTTIPAYIDHVLWLGNDKALIKKMLINHGVLSTSMQADFSDVYYNSSDFTFYYNGEEGVDHGVAIVGWDDHKVVTGGTAGSPKNKGAWIIRNSWGESSNDGGYFYASYEDVHIGKSCELYYGKTPVSDIDTLFDDAKLGAITAYNGGDGSSDFAYAAVKHHANTDYFVTHVGAAILTEGTTIDITLCKSFDGTSFSDTIAHSSGIFCPYAGYQKVEFPAVVRKGDFYLIVKYHTPNDIYPLPAEVVVEDYAYPTIEEGKMWVSADGLDWTAGGLNTDYDFDLAVKVIAKQLDEIQAYFSSNKSLACLDQNITFENKTIGEADSFVWHFPEESFVTRNKNENITLSFQEKGQKTITLIAYKNGIAHTFTRQNAVTIVDQIYPHITVVGAADFYAKKQDITLIGSGADSYQWYAADYLNGENGRSITFAPNVDSIWVRMETTLGNCFESDSVLIRMKEVLYDNIEDALLLTLNVPVEDVSNAYASVQKQEPMPTIGSCESQDSWCEEGGLHNSIWFKFVAPTTGRATINTTGFDNQIALYDATATGTWQDIMSGNSSNYSILAANDDYHTVDYAAKINDVTGLTPGKMYWIQMDGSGGGAVGKIRITLSSIGTAIDEAELTPTLEVINTAKLFRISDHNISGAQLSIINSMGQIVYAANMSAGKVSTSGKELPHGFYLIHIENQHFNTIYKVVISEHWQLSINE